MDWSLMQQQAMQQARCPDCNAPLGGEHRGGCHWAEFYYKSMMNAAYFGSGAHLRDAAYFDQQAMNAAVPFADAVENLENTVRNISLEHLMRNIPVPEPEPRKWTWGDLLIEGLRADLRRFGKWLRGKCLLLLARQNSTID